jgi:hypothetical protein
MEGTMASTETSGKNYICVSVHEATSDAPDFPPRFEERLNLIKASSMKEATEKAAQIVGQARHTYKNEAGETITWTCRRIYHVVDMFDNALTDGGEIYSRGFWDMAEYERFEAHVMGGP